MRTSFLLLVSCCVLLAGCDLEQNPVAETSREAVFNNENGLALYTNSFYNMLPSADDITRGDGISDYGARKPAPDFIVVGAYDARSSDGGWSWSALRNINYFLANNVDPAVPEAVRQHYNGLARFFRAWFYFEKVKRYGDVPWIDKPLDVDDPSLYAGRDPREVVMQHVLEDINFAIDNIAMTNDASRTMISRDVALAFKSRIALFEGTFRKYHPEWGLSDTADEWLNEAVSAAREIMDSGRYSLYEGAGEDMSYRRLFTSDDPVASEIMLAVVSDLGLGVTHTANWTYTSGTFWVRYSFIRTFMNTYLNIDGTPFTDREGYETMTFMEEVKGRDKRLQQTIRMGDYTRTNSGISVPAPPAFTYTWTGYQPIKWTLDEIAIDGGSRNTNAVSIFRYAEVLLNYAEAKAELGTITDADWAETVGALRRRAGITGGLNSLPTQVDPYLQQVYFPDIANPVILEIRRERAIELVLEGFRFYDLVRWKRGDLMEMQWNGMYVPSVNQYMDLNEDGTPDVYFATVMPEERIDGVVYIDVTGPEDRLANGTSGEITILNTIPRVWEDRHYLYPIPEVHLLKNPALGQNPGWE